MLGWLFQLEQEKKEYKQAGEGEAKSVSWLAGWWMSCSFFLGVAKNRLVLGLKAAPTSPECASTGVRGDPTPRRGELTRVRGCDRTWRCHGRDRGRCRPYEGTGSLNLQEDSDVSGWS